MQKFLSGILWVNIKSQVIITHQGANIGITEQKKWISIIFWQHNVQILLSQYSDSRMGFPNV